MSGAALLVLELVLPLVVGLGLGLLVGLGVRRAIAPRAEEVRS